MNGEVIKRDEDVFSNQLEALQQCIEKLSYQASDMPQRSLDSHNLEELRLALEELQVTEEELRQQHEELVIARRVAEIGRQRYQELFEFAPDGYLVTDTHGVIREGNRTAAKLLTLEQRFLVGKPLSSFVPDEQRRSFRSVLNQLQTVDRLQEWELQLRGRSGSLFDAAITVEAVRDWQGKVSSLRWLIRDITARKQAEEQLRLVQLQNLQLLEADRAKSQFMATMSHELRTPMNAILGFSDLLRRSTQLDAQHVSMIERIFRNGKHLLSLIEEILDFAKLKAHQVELKLTSFDLVELTTETIEELQSLSQQKNLELRMHFPQPSLWVVNDPARLRQVLVNLLSNAIKFTHEGYVQVGVEAVTEERVAIVVRDTGIGIDPTYQLSIFQEFWQVNQSSTRQQGGTGLGLSITTALVHLMQGTIAVESQVNVGSTFRVELPRCLK
jgi:PAS domain S-box-containing protein